MAEQVDMPEPPRFAPAVTEDLLAGARKLREAFVRTPIRSAGSDEALVLAGDREAGAILIRRGMALRSLALGDTRRAVLDIMVAGDFAGLDSIVLARPADSVTAVNRVSYHLLTAAALRDLIADRGIALYLISALAGQRSHADRLAASLGRLDAEARLCAMLIEVHDRLRHRELTSRPSFNLPLTQQQIADYLGLTVVHVNRTLRRLREEKIVLLDRHVAIIMDLDRLRAAAEGRPQVRYHSAQPTASEGVQP